MKTIKKGGRAVRVTDKVAQRMTKKDGWVYCPKSVWKARRKDEATAVKEA